MLKPVKTIGAILGFGLMLVMLSCVTTPTEPEFDNPLDPDIPDYVPPLTTLTTEIAPTIHTSSLTLSWQGTTLQCEYAWRLDAQPYTDWLTDTTLTLDYLDEGDHAFEIKCRYPTGDEETTPLRVAFTVDAVPNQSLLLYPYRVEAVNGQPLVVELQAHGITGLTALEVNLEYNGSSLRPDSALTGPFLAKDGGNIIAFREVGTAWNVSTGVAQGPTTGVAGSGTILTYRFEVLSMANSTLTLTVVDARGPDDEAVSIATVRGGVVEVGE
ncbi:cohesin domain-containing protein [Candidatus Neomarinimicrobiota bacterium]